MKVGNENLLKWVGIGIGEEGRRGWEKENMREKSLNPISTSLWIRRRR